MDKKRYEREIEEILRKAEEDGWAGKSGAKANAPDDIKPQRRSSPTPRPPKPPRTGSLISPGTILGIAFVALIVIVLMRPFAVVLSTLLTPIAVIGLLGAFFYYYAATSRGPKADKRWRGQSVNIDDPNEPFAAIKRTLNRWFGRR